MTEHATHVLESALRLPHEARAFLAERLLESLDAEPEFPVSEGWRKEIVRRCEEIDRGEVDLIPGAEVFRNASDGLR